MNNRCSPIAWITCYGAWLLLGALSGGYVQSTAAEPVPSRPALQIISRVVTTNRPGFLSAIYAEPKGSRLFGLSSVSEDNGRSWSPLIWKPDFAVDLPHGFRRDPVTAVLDARTDRLLVVFNALDTPGLDPNIIEPPIAQETYYLRYRVSADGGRTWLGDEPIIQTGDYDAKHPVAGVWVGTNAIYLGDVGCLPIITRQGHVLVPAQMTVVGSDGKLANPAGGFTYTEVVVLIGTWTREGRLRWTASQQVRGDAFQTTRGLIEPTLAEFADGRILMVMRGSNGGKADPQSELPSRKWFCVSKDGGETWSQPAVWTYTDGEAFFSPSSMSTLFKHSSGRVFWAGNWSTTNCEGNLPRWPLVIGEVDAHSLKLMRNTLLTLDTKRPEDEAQGRLDLSHFTLLEDRETGDIIVCYPRAHHAYQSYEWATVRLALTGR
ncbi:MAG: glycoside hydrolase [Verrucomicrobiae bacterium]|nr:glycoside hydrolase [Verrucomicrobiae bacterium]